MPGARCLPRRMDPPASRHPGCRRDVATLRLHARTPTVPSMPENRLFAESGASWASAMSRRPRPICRTTSWLRVRRAFPTRPPASRQSGVAARRCEPQNEGRAPAFPDLRGALREVAFAAASLVVDASLSRFQRTSLLSSPRLTQKRGKSRSSVTGARRRKLGTRRCLRSSARLSPPVRTWARAGRAASSSSGASERGC